MSNMMTRTRKALDCSIVAVVTVMVFLLAGCEPAALDRDSGGKGSVIVRLGVPATKAASGTDVSLPVETRIDVVDLLVYQNGIKVYGERFSSGSVFSVDLEPGSYEIFVVANAKTFDPKTFGTYADLKAQTITLQDAVPGVADNPAPGYESVQGMLMAGYTSGVVVNYGQTSIAYVNMDRYAARVRLLTVTGNYSGGPLSGINPSFGGAWLENVRSQWNVARSGDATGLVLPAGRLSNGTDAIPQPTDANRRPLAKAVEENYGYIYAAYISGSPFSGSWTGSQPVDINAVMFCLPNALAEGGDHYGPTTADCRTRLVVDIYGAADWFKYRYYPITIDSPKAGWTYDVRMTFSGRGTDDPNEKYSRDGGISVSVEAWKEGHSFDSYGEPTLSE